VSESFQLDRPEHFTAGTVGRPGQRTFYLQAREGTTLITLKCEKEQINALAEYLSGLLARLPGRAEPAGERAELLQPIESSWDVGSLGVGYDGDNDRIVVVANERAAEDEDDEETTATPRELASARFAISRAQAAAFVERARSLQKAGRPTCPMCGEPKDPSGHVCPRSNGHVVPKT
jgi:uncharacterized repeat protein (TIGR03847 family)